MTHTTIAPYGSWKSPISSELIVGETIGLTSIAAQGQNIYWIENRPKEAGRNVLIQRTPDGKTTNLTPPEINIRTRVHEYGGGACLVTENNIFFSNFSDGRLYQQTSDTPPQALTPEAIKMRYADAIFDKQHNRLICVREDHTGTTQEPINTLVSIKLDQKNSGEILVSGDDFYASARLSPDGKKLTWISWNHPNLPWDSTQLWVAEILPDGSLAEKQLIAGGPEESIFQPEWSPDGVLYFVSDRTGWWNLYRHSGEKIEPLCEMEAEFGRPQWVFGMQTYTFISAQKIICTYTQNGLWHLAILDTHTKTLQPIETPYTDITELVVVGNSALLLAGSALEPTAIVQLDFTSNSTQVLRRSSEINLDSGYLSKPQSIEFPTENGLTAHAFLYMPQNRDYKAPDGEKPPLIVKSHGGPTSAASSRFSLSIQYWTSRGFAFLDVNYGGSTGYGRNYRRRLDNAWGIVDVDDCINAARYVSSQNIVDSNRLAITGGSAGGYTTLCALTFKDVFKAGASYYGIGDLEALARDTHKFEARYLDRLIGPYPDRQDLYQQRSPIHYTDRLSCPVIFFQGLEDKVVTPNQAESMVEALKAKKLPVAYLPFEGEQHGFRRAENIKRALDGEFYFYSQVFGFLPADNIQPVEIFNL